MDRTINGIRLIKTCSACPEQYDAYHCGLKVGYLRLRHGHFTVECPDVGDKRVLETLTAGGGMFDDDEREAHLLAAVAAIRMAYHMPQYDDYEPPMEDTRDYLEVVTKT